MRHLRQDSVVASPSLFRRRLPASERGETTEGAVLTWLEPSRVAEQDDVLEQKRQPPIVPVAVDQKPRLHQRLLGGGGNGRAVIRSGGAHALGGGGLAVVGSLFVLTSLQDRDLHTERSCSPCTQRRPCFLQGAAIVGSPSAEEGRCGSGGCSACSSERRELRARVPECACASA